MGLAEELECVADELGDRRLRALAHVRLLDHLLELGDIKGVEREVQALQRLAETRRERAIKWVVTVFRANHAFLQGRLEDCESLAHAALADRYEGHDEPAARTFGVQMLFVRGQQGRLDELIEAVEGSVAQYPQMAGWRCVLAQIYAQLECRAQARQELEALARADFCDLPRDGNWLVSLSALCRVVVVLDDVPRARLLYEMLLPYADRCVVVGVLMCTGSISRTLGLLATTMSRYEDAAHHFDQALKMNAQIRSPLWIAHTQHDYGYMLLVRNHPGDRDKALQFLNEALATADQLSLKALADKTRPLKIAAEANGPSPAASRFA